MLFDRLVRAQIVVWNALDARLRADHDLPLTWFEPMRVIGRRGTARVQDIAQDLLITAGGASKLVDRMETAGHVVRARHPSDRRSSHITLTTDGTRLLAAAERTARETVHDVAWGDLPDRDRRRLIAALDHIRTRASAGVSLESAD